MEAELLRNIRLVHGRDTCDEAGRPLSTYLCDYHQGVRDGLELFEPTDAFETFIASDGQPAIRGRTGLYRLAGREVDVNEEDG